MLVKAFVDEGLGNSSYLLASESTGLAVVVDPQRDVDKYLQTAAGLGLRVVHTVETHLHADFVSGGREAFPVAGVPVGASWDAHLAFERAPWQTARSCVWATFASACCTRPDIPPST